MSIVERAVDPDPRQRFQSAGAFEMALARFLGAPAEDHDVKPRLAQWIALSVLAAAALVGACAIATSLFAHAYAHTLSHGY